LEVLFKPSEVATNVQVSIIIPVFNEEDVISISLAQVRKSIGSILSNYEIIIVNDGSTDNTLKVLEKEKERDAQHIQIISYALNKGKGYAIRTGVIKSRGSIVVLVDGDLDISPFTIKDYIKELENCSLVIASKHHPLSKVTAPLSRKLLSKLFNKIVQIAIGIRLKDTQAGLKAGSGDAFRTIFDVMVIRRYAFDVEFLAIATLLNLSIKELPIEVSLDNNFRIVDIAKMLIDLALLVYRLKIRRYYYKQLIAQKSQN
jgi:glycosyltransferase involved in cell wall biosynthesis